MGWTEMLLIDVPLFAAATFSVINFYLVSQREIYPDWRSRVKYLPIVMAVGIGLAVNNSRAVIEALMATPASSRARRSTASSARRTTCITRSTTRRCRCSR